MDELKEVISVLSSSPPDLSGRCLPLPGWPAVLPSVPMGSPVMDSHLYGVTFNCSGSDGHSRGMGFHPVRC